MNSTRVLIERWVRSVAFVGAQAVWSCSRIVLVIYLLLPQLWRGVRGAMGWYRMGWDGMGGFCEWN